MIGWKEKAFGDPEEAQAKEMPQLKDVKPAKNSDQENSKRSNSIRPEQNTYA
ncbi:hypothetical protein KSB_25450 [Ktedonobacter robiniae]|uniref:Uncharacterized protein n=1 Tax=Ktedonobacter robiniae TaxID=2778365 RepID=A0ABQ3UNX1_9CHLR|nr:hypothetical protein KSB_25450 [Ktedonobacter robiniae]